MLPSASKLKSPIFPLFQTSNLTGPTLSMVTFKKFYYMTCPLFWESLLPSCTMWMKTCTMTSSLEDLSLAFHLASKTPIDWYSKKQATVETTTYGSAFIAAHISVDQSIDLKNTLCYLGVPVHRKHTCLEITSQWWIALLFHMPNSISATMLCLFIKFEKPLQEPSLDSTTLMAMKTLLTS